MANVCSIPLCLCSLTLTHAHAGSSCLAHTIAPRTAMNRVWILASIINWMIRVHFTMSARAQRTNWMGNLLSINGRKCRKCSQWASISGAQTHARIALLASNIHNLCCLAHGSAFASEENRQSPQWEHRLTRLVGKTSIREVQWRKSFVFQR